DFGDDLLELDRIGCDAHSGPVRGVSGPGDGQDVVEEDHRSAMLERSGHLSAGAAALAGLDHDGRGGVSAHDGVAFEELPLLRAGSWQVGGDDEPALSDLFLQLKVALGVALVPAVGNHGDSATSRVEGRSVRGRVDAE